MSAVPRSPNRSTCRNCGHRISWGDLGYTHDDSGFGDCGIIVNELTGEIAKAVDVETTAEPIEWDEERFRCSLGHKTRVGRKDEKMLPCGCVVQGASDEALRDAGLVE